MLSSDLLLGGFVFVSCSALLTKGSLALRIDLDGNV